MKKSYLLLLAVTAFGLSASAQILNQSANWPNGAWTITGSYSTNPLAFEANPTTTPNFAFDDDDAGSSHEDNIAAESPVTDLTAAAAAGENYVQISVQYGYRYLANDVLRFEYWNADTAAWIAWGANIPGNNTSISDNFCTIPKTTLTSIPLGIGAFTPTQLAGFKYRISYNDDPAGADYNYGFCFSSPTLTSLGCVSPATLAAANVTASSADISWAAIAGTNGFEYVLDNTASNPTSGTTISANSYNAAGLTPATTYYFHVRTICSAGTSVWSTISFMTNALPPANDNCNGAIALTVNPDYTCGSAMNATLSGATNSGVASTTGTADDDVWFSFVATATAHRITLTNVTGTPTDLVHQTLSGSCGSLTNVLYSDPDTSNLTGLVIGATYYVRVFSYAAGGVPTTNFKICIGTPPPPPANDNCNGAIALTVNPDYACGSALNATLSGATNSGVASTTGTADDDVWFSFVATATAHRITLTNVTGTPTDLVHQTLSGSCGSLTNVLYSDPDTSNLTGLVIGNTYYVRVYSYASGVLPSTNFKICIGTPPAPPANDNFANAIAVSCGGTVSGDTTDATIDEDNAPDGFGSDLDARNVWYKYIGNGSQETVTLSLCGSSYDTTVLVYTGTSGNLTLVAGNDDSSACTTANNSLASFTSDGVTTYYITVEGYNSTNYGAFSMAVSCAAVTPPAVANQTCALSLAVPIDGTDTISDNSFGTVNPVQPSCDSFGSIQDVWFSFVAPASGSVQCLVTNGTMTSSNFNVYSGTCGALVAVDNACNSNLTTPTTEVLTGLTVGATYYVQVWSNASEQGTFTLRVTDSTLGTVSFENDNFKYYPNPVKNILNLSHTKDISSVAVYNLLGQQVIAKTVNSTQSQIDMSDLAKGTYMVKVTSENQVKTIKVIKE